MDDLKLAYGYTFWLQEVERGKNSQNYGSNLKEITTVKTIKEFWEIYQFLKKTNELPKDCDLYLFRQGVAPQWQDKANVGGGCFKIKIDKKKSNKLWQNAILSLINPNNKYNDILNGVRIKIKQKFDEIEIWMSRQSANKEKLENVKAYLKENLQVTEQRGYVYVAFK